MATPEVYLKCACKNCGGHLSFPRSAVASSVTCPHCNWPTELTANIPAPGDSATGDRNRFYKTLMIAGVVLIVAAGIVAGVVLIGGREAAYRIWFPRKAVHGPVPRRDVATQPNAGDNVKTNPPAPAVVEPPPDPWHGLMAGPVALEKSKEGNLVYAVGKLKNSSSHQRFAVKVELDIYNAKKKKIGTATDYTGSIDPGKAWTFRAMVTDRAAKSAIIASVKED